MLNNIKKIKTLYNYIVSHWVFLEKYKHVKKIANRIIVYLLKSNNTALTITIAKVNIMLNPRAFKLLLIMAEP